MIAERTFHHLQLLLLFFNFYRGTPTAGVALHSCRSAACARACFFLVINGGGVVVVVKLLPSLTSIYVSKSRTHALHTLDSNVFQEIKRKKRNKMEKREKRARTLRLNAPQNAKTNGAATAVNCTVY